MIHAVKCFSLDATNHSSSEVAGVEHYGDNKTGCTGMASQEV
jgi:hypothetical protein